MLRVLTSLCLFVALSAPARAVSGTRFEVSFPAELRSQPLTGRALIVLSRKSTPEPRHTISPYGSPLFAIDVEGLEPDQTAVLDENALGYPRKNLRELEAGDYFAQALVIPYRECPRSDGHTIWVPMVPCEALALHQLPENLFSDVVAVHHDPASSSVVKLSLTKKIPPIDPRPDTEWLKRFVIQSRLLTDFWGVPVRIAATVLLPKGYDEHLDVKYPAVYVHEHSVPFSFNSDPASQAREGRSKSSGLQTGYEFYQSWISDDFPRMVAITFHQATPYFPSSYSVNSANNGPYGDALLQEMIPALEKEFRLIPEPHARLLEGASTGGWEALALQLYHPDFFGGAWIFNPDPIDFRRYQLVNIYEDENAFEIPATEWRTTERPMRRTTEGQVLDTMRSMSAFEAVLGSRGRSAYQFGGWEAVYGPVGADGYPVPLWDKQTGKIDRAVAEFMREHGFDLRAYAAEHWSTLGPKLADKLHFFAGEMDNFHLNLAVYLFEDFLASTADPQVPGEFEYGRPLKGHNWHAYDWAELLRRMAEHVREHAPIAK